MQPVDRYEATLQQERGAALHCLFDALAARGRRLRAAGFFSDVQAYGDGVQPDDGVQASNPGDGDGAGNGQ